MAWLIHSAKGTSWKEHQYIKKEKIGGVKEFTSAVNNALKGGKSGASSKLEDWEVKMHKHISNIVDSHPDIFKTGEDVSKNIMASVNSDAFKKTLKAITGMDPDKMSEEEINSMRKKISDYYTKDYKDESSGGGVSSRKKSSKKKEALNKNDDYDYGHRSTKKKEALNKNDDYDYEHRSTKKSSAKHSDISDDTLEHFGILGMKWGVRRFQNKNGSYTEAGRKRYNKGNDTTEKSKEQKPQKTPEEIARDKSTKKSDQVRSHSESKNLKDISDEDLQKMIRRLELEKRYSELTTPKETKKVNKGKEFITGVLTQSARAVAVAGATYVMGKALNKALGVDVVNVAKGAKASSDEAKHSEQSQPKKKEKNRHTSSSATFLPTLR